VTKVYDSSGRRIIAALWDEISQIPDRVNEIAVLTDPNKLQYVGWNDVANELQLLDFDAADIPYDNSGSGLVATDVQAAIDELAAAAGIGTVFSG
jgi:chaperonin cofactor prefoldin